MAFNAGELVATIRLDGVGQFQRDAQSAGESLSRAGQQGGRFGNAVRSGMQAAAGATTAASVAAGAYLTSLARTGAAYNTLQQTSRAALTTLMGSAEAANEQMSKLDDFARNSPFSKSTFIQAQQQLIGFGIEAEKVIPILGAVQDATAAVGGSNQQIGEIVSILAKISSSGKITAEDLNMLGERGIDAASLLGEGFGKSAAQIREDITAGALDAGEAINVLTEQMTSRFGGAAANVKQTWAGAVDRISAAQREIGAALAEPFISQQGGGLAVTWGNQVADVLRAVLGHVEPIVTIMGDRLAPAFAGITAGLDTARVVVKSWDSSSLETFLNQAETYAPAIAALGGAILGWTGSMLSGIPILGSFVGALSPVGGALGAVALASPEVRSALSDLLGAFAPLAPVAEDLARILAGSLNSALPVVAGLIEGVVAVASPLLDVLGEIPTPVVAAVAAFLTLRPALKGVADGAQPLLDAFKRIGEGIAVQAALGAMEGNTSKLAGTMGYASSQVRGLGDSLKAAFIANPVGLALTGISIAIAAVTAAFAAAQQETAEQEERIVSYRDTLVDTTAALTDATRAQVEKNLADTEAYKQAEQLGLSRDVVTRAALGEKDAVKALADEMSRQESAWKAAKESGDGVTAAMEDNWVAIYQLVEATTTQRDAIEAAQDAQRKYRDQVREANAAMSEAERSSQRINDALAILRDTSSDASSKLSALKQVLDELNGGTKTQEEALRDFHEQVLNLADAFARTDEEGNNLARGLIDQSGAIDTRTRAGQELFDQVKALNDAYLEEVIAADAAAKAKGEDGISTEEARGIYARYEDQLRKAAEGAGVAEGAVDGLIGTMLETPEVVAFAVNDDGTVDANKLRLIDLATQILATPDGEFNITEDDIPGLMEALAALGFKVTALPDGTVHVQGNGIDSTISSLAHLHGQIYDRQETITTYHNHVINETTIRNGNKYITPEAANGALYSGGALAFANGGQVQTGIYRGGPPIIKFAEPETRWEAFISGKAGQERRNRRIAAEAVRRLGGVATFDPSMFGGKTAAFANGGILDTQRKLDATVQEEYTDWSNWMKARKLADDNPEVEWIQEREKRYRDGWKDAESRRKALERELESQKEQLSSERNDWAESLRWGDPQKQGVNGGGRSLVNQLRDVAKDTGGKAGADMLRQANESEKAFRKLEAQARKAAEAIEAAEDRKERLVDAAEDRKEQLVGAAEKRKEKLVGAAEDRKAKLIDAAEAKKTKLVDAAEAKRAKLLDAAEARRDKVIEAARERADAKMRAETDRANAYVDKVTSKWNAAVEKAASKLDTLRTASESMASAVANTIRSKFDLGVLATATTKTRTVTERGSKTVGGIKLTTSETREVQETVPVTAKSVKSGLWAQAKSAKALAAKIKRLGQMGFSSGFIQEVLALGLEQAEPMIDALLTMSKKDIADVNSLYRTIGKAAETTGSAVADRYYASSIAAAEKQLAATEKVAAREIAAAEKRADRIIASAKAWGEAQVRAATLKGDQIVANATKQGDRLVSNATKQGDRLIANATRQGDRAVWAAKQQGDRMVWAAKEQGDRAIWEARKLGDRQIKAAKDDAAAIRANLKAETDRVINAISKALGNPWALENQKKGLGGVKKAATGGPVIGPGTGTSDSIAALLSNGEWVNTAHEVDAVGGFAGMQKLRSLILNGSIKSLLDGQLSAFANGGPVVRVPVPVTRSVPAPVASAQPVQHVENNYTIPLIPQANEPVQVQARRAIRAIDARRKLRN